MIKTIEDKDKLKRDCPAGNDFIQNIVFSMFFITLSIISCIYYFSHDNIKIKEIFSLISFSFGGTLFLTGVTLSIVYTFMKFNKPNGGFGLFFWTGGFLLIWGILLNFMQKVG